MFSYSVRAALQVECDFVPRSAVAHRQMNRPSGTREASRSLSFYELVLIGDLYPESSMAHLFLTP